MRKSAQKMKVSKLLNLVLLVVISSIAIAAMTAVV